MRKGKKKVVRQGRRGDAARIAAGLLAPAQAAGLPTRARVCTPRVCTPRVKPARLLASTILAGLALAPAAYANPVDGVVVAGSASISASGAKLDVVQASDRAVIDWRGFDIGAGEHTQFTQPSSSSIALNRVNSNAPSKIDGRLSANGQVVIVNQSGILFGKTAQVDVSGLIATTADIDNDKFMAGGTLAFDKPGKANAAIVNEGSITAREAGLVGLVAPNVVNSGVITAKLGKVHLASGDTATVDLYGDKLLEVAVSDQVTSQLIANTGVIQADGGSIAITAAAGAQVVNSLVSVSGSLQAQSVSEHNGKIEIVAYGSNAVKDNTASAKGIKTGSSNVLVSGMLDASGRKAGERGGSITVTGDNVALLAGTIIDASGHTGLSGTTTGKLKSDKRNGSAGGEILIGGDYLGQGTTATAKNLYVSSGALILNDSLSTGDAGRSIFWSDNDTSFYGAVYARALGGKAVDSLTWDATTGGNTGDGGFVETSGHAHLNAGGYVNLTSSNGARGTYFLDPTDITIYGNVDPSFVSTDSSINLAASLKLWLDAADTSKVQLTYSADSLSSATASGTMGNNTITTSLDVSSSLAIGARIRLGAAGSITTADTLGADTYTITGISGTTITLSSNLSQNYTASNLYRGLVSQWDDKSGNGYNATQATEATMGLFVTNYTNGRSAIYFGYAGMAIDTRLSLGAPYTANVIFNRVTGAGPGRALQGIDNNWLIGPYNNNVAHWAGSCVSGVFCAGSPLTYNTLYSTFAVNDAANSHFFSQSVDITNSTSPIDAPGRLGIGIVGQYAEAPNGYIPEITIYNSILSTDSRNLIEQYQSAKWGIALTPPGTGVTEADKAMASDGYSVFTTRYLERLSQSADISLQASNNINFDFKGDTLALANGRNFTLTTGNALSSVSAGTITTTQSAGSGGNISLSAGAGGIDFHNMTLNSGGTLTATSSGAQVFNSFTGKALTATTTGATGDITFSGDINTNGSTALTAYRNLNVGNVTVTGNYNNLSLYAANNSVNGTGLLTINGNLNISNGNFLLTSGLDGSSNRADLTLNYTNLTYNNAQALYTIMLGFRDVTVNTDLIAGAMLDIEAYRNLTVSNVTGTGTGGIMLFAANRNPNSTGTLTVNGTLTINDDHIILSSGIDGFGNRADLTLNSSNLVFVNGTVDTAEFYGFNNLSLLRDITSTTYGFTFGANNNLILSANLTNTVSGRGFHFNGTPTTLTGNSSLTTNSGAITLGAVDGGYNLSLISGMATTTLGAVGDATPLNNLSITADDVVLNGNLSGNGALTLKPYTAAQTMGIGGGAGTFNISAAEMGRIQAGWNSVTIGRNDSTGSMVFAGTGGLTPKLILYGNDITFNGASGFMPAGGLEANSTFGDITVSQALGDGTTLATDWLSLSSARDILINSPIDYKVASSVSGTRYINIVAAHDLLINNDVIAEYEVHRNLLLQGGRDISISNADIESHMVEGNLLIYAAGGNKNGTGKISIDSNSTIFSDGNSIVSLISGDNSGRADLTVDSRFYNGSYTPRLTGFQNVDFNQTFTSLRTLEIDINGIFTLNADLNEIREGTGITASGGIVLNAANITHKNNGFFLNSPVTLKRDVTITDTRGYVGFNYPNIYFGGTVNSDSALTPRSLTITSLYNTVELSQGAGGIAPLNNLTITGADVTLGGNIYGKGALTLKPSTASQTMAIGTGAAGDFALSNTELGYIGLGWNSVTIGRNDASGALQIGAAVFPTLGNSAVYTINGGTVDFIGNAVIKNSANIYARSGGMVFSAAQSHTSDLSNTKNFYSNGDMTIDAPINFTDYSYYTSLGFYSNLGTSGDIVVNSDISTTNGLILRAKNNLTVANGVTLTASGNVQPFYLQAADNSISGDGLLNYNGVAHLGNNIVNFVSGLGTGNMRNDLTLNSTNLIYSGLGCYSTTCLMGLSISGFNNVTLNRAIKANVFNIHALDTLTINSTLDKASLYDNILRGDSKILLNADLSNFTVASATDRWALIGPVIVNGNRSISTSETGGGITFSGTVDGATSGLDSLTVNSGAGTTTFSSTIGTITPLNNFSITADGIAFGGNIIANGTVTLAPYTQNATIGFSGGAGALQITQAMMNYIHAPTVTIGRSDGTGLMTTGTYNWNSTLTNLNLLGGNITVDGNITSGSSSGTQDKTLTLKANNDIVVNFNQIVSSSAPYGKLHTVFNSDADTSQAGAIIMKSGSGILSNGGNIMLGGGADPIIGYAYGNGANDNGITLSNATLDASGGNIIMRGYSTASGASGDASGIMNASGLISTTGNGNITLDGIGRYTSGHSSGVNVIGAITVADGTLTINGIDLGGSGRGVGTTVNNTLSADGSGSIAVNGDAFGMGVLIWYGGQLATTSGDIDVTGTLTTSNGNNTYGISFEGSSGTPNLLYTTGGDITLTGNINGHGLAGINFNTGGLITRFGNGSQTGDITFIADSILSAPTSIQTSGTVTFAPNTVSTTIGVAGGAGTLQLTQAILDSITAGSITIGRVDGTGAITANGYAWDKDVSFVTGTGGIALAGVQAMGAHRFVAHTTGASDITIGASGGVSSSASGNAIVLASGRHFINNAGANALSAPNGRWLVYSKNASGSTIGGLGGFRRFASSYSGYAPGAVTESGNGFLYADASLGTISITADNISRQYGDANPAFTYSFTCTTGCTQGASITGAPSLGTNATQGSNVGSYGITIGLGSVALNNAYADYELSLTGGSLSITPRALSIAAENKSKGYGASDPGLTYRITTGSLYGADMLSGALSRAAGEAAGNYAIGLGTVSAGTNYTVDYTSALFTILVAPSADTHGNAQPSAAPQGFMLPSSVIRTSQLPLAASALPVMSALSIANTTTQPLPIVTDTHGTPIQGIFTGQQNPQSGYEFTPDATSELAPSAGAQPYAILAIDPKLVRDFKLGSVSEF